MTGTSFFSPNFELRYNKNPHQPKMPRLSSADKRTDTESPDYKSIIIFFK